MRGTLASGLLLLLLSGSLTAQEGMPFQYAAKVVCGKSSGKVLSPGLYYTAVNVHNPSESEAAAQWKVATALPAAESGPVSTFQPLRFKPDGALEIDCAQVMRLSRTGDFIKGFVVVESKTELDVVAVYTAGPSGTQVQTLDVERVPARRQVMTGCPDLIVETIDPPVWDDANHQSVIRATIRNVGSAPAAASLARVIDPSTPQPSGPPYNAVANTPALAPGQAATVTFYLPYWVYNPDVTLEVTADYKGMVTECDENNNKKMFSGIG